jgi:hypothetical protein
MPIPLIHCTDIYHPHADPDDHWDLATAYALTKAGHADLRAVIFDDRQNERLKDLPSAGDPAIQAVAQMNHITGLAVPGVAGSPVSLRDIADDQSDLDVTDRAAADLILRVLEDAAEPVSITIVGSARDVAIAGNRAPELFEKKCRGIYPVIGTGTTDPDKGANSDHNLLLDTPAFRALFEIPCPVYWTPCVETFIPGKWIIDPQQYSCCWLFRQDEILPHLSPRVQNYFLYALTPEADNRWQRYLAREVDGEKLAKVGEQPRHMWSTAPLMHAAGMSVRNDGTMIPLEQANGDAVFGYERVRVQTFEKGIESWALAADAKNRFIFENKDLAQYPLAMTQALKQLLCGL